MVLSGKRDTRLTFTQHFYCGALAGIIAKSFTAPLDVVKIRTQIGTHETQNGVVKSFYNIWKHGTLRSFWIGNFVGCIRIVPYSVIQLFMFQRMKLKFADSTGRLSPTTALIAGSGAGLCATVIMYPTDVIKTRLIIQKLPFTDNYKSIYEITKKIAQKEGIRAFYKGISVSILGAVPFAGATFLAYEGIDMISSYVATSEKKTSLLFLFLSSCAISAFAQTLSYPFDRLRKMLQAQNAIEVEKIKIFKFSNASEAFTGTLKNHGILGLWKGNYVNMLKILPYTITMILTYEIAKYCCLYKNGYLVKPFHFAVDESVDQTLKPEELQEFLEEIDSLNHMLKEELEEQY